jgi:hypothetical protein
MLAGPQFELLFFFEQVSAQEETKANLGPFLCLAGTLRRPVLFVHFLSRASYFRRNSSFAWTPKIWSYGIGVAKGTL